VSEKAVQKALNKLMKGRTCIAIAHRLSTIMDSDKIVVIDEKKVFEEGTHAELVVKPKGKYVDQHLYNNQCSEIFTLRNEKFHTEA
jgi:ATP-binding cassette subfamily B protein